MDKPNNKDKIQELLLAKTRIRKRLEKINEIFEQEKENEEAWPGHAGGVFQLADSEYQVLLGQLSLIESELKKLGVKDDEPLE
jgi:hypothetical protein